MVSLTFIFSIFFLNLSKSYPPVFQGEGMKPNTEAGKKPEVRDKIYFQSTNITLIDLYKSTYFTTIRNQILHVLSKESNEWVKCDNERVNLYA